MHNNSLLEVIENTPYTKTVNGIYNTSASAFQQ